MSQVEVAADLSEATAEVPGIREGLFFTTPPDLPKGRHDKSRQEIHAAQRERLMIAVTELMAHNGYRGIGVREIVTRARVSQAAFYECYADKDQCVFAAYDRFIALLLERVGGALEMEGTWAEIIHGVVRAYLNTLDEDPVVARAFQVEMDALGRPARDRRRDALVGMAMVLKAKRERLWPDAPTVADSAYSGAVFAVRQLASDALDANVPTLTGMSDEIGTWIGTLFDPASRLRPL